MEREDPLLTHLNHFGNVTDRSTEGHIRLENIRHRVISNKPIDIRTCKLETSTNWQKIRNVPTTLIKQKQLDFMNDDEVAVSVCLKEFDARLGGSSDRPFKYPNIELSRVGK